MSSPYRIDEFAERIGCLASTVCHWEAEGSNPCLSATVGQRYFKDSDVRTLLQAARLRRGRAMNLRGERFLGLMDASGGAGR
ncbi:MerR family transcriptional regulator [Micromonospora zhanjiangensis]|uniref:MerR family transcriptional regulator n=1 Tax=Micromonospora zhanjiangensis TaxID=1522057 RepID=A0ABV8KV26_9ACTN